MTGIGAESRAPQSTQLVMVQPEMERGRSPLVSIPPFGLIVAPPRPSVSTSGLPVIHSLDGVGQDHFTSVGTSECQSWTVGTLGVLPQLELEKAFFR